VAGTGAYFQSYPCKRVAFRRSRGCSGDTSVVEIAADALLELRKPASLVGGRETADADTSLLDKDEAVPAPLAKLLNHEGTLELVSPDSKGKNKTVKIEGLFVTRVEGVRSDTVGKVTLWRLYLADERFFWPRGVMTRWSFNRRRGDGEHTKDSVQNDGKPFTLSAIVRDYVTKAIFRSPEVSAMPTDWFEATPSWEFRPFEIGAKALAAIVTEQGLEDPCLRFDRTVALHEAGDGAVAEASDGKGENRDPIPPQHWLYKNGAGVSKVLELGYPEEYLIVVGGQRVVSVAVDGWEPVLMVNGKAEPLTEETVRRVTGGRYGLTWLHTILLEPAALQHAEGVTDAVMTLLREQSYRYFQMPGAVERDPKTGDVKPGYNAHLLPMRDRAEIDGGKRRSVTVETFRYDTITKPVGTEEELREAEALRSLNKIRGRIDAAAAAAGRVSPFNFSNPDESLGTTGLLLPSTPNIPSSTFEAARREALNSLLIQRLDGGLASEYEKALKESLSARDALNATSTSELFETVKEAVQLSREIAKGGSGADVARAKLPGVSDRLEKLDAQFKSKAETATRDKSLGQTAGHRLNAVNYKNKDREPDPGAQVVSATQGVVRTRELAGWLKNDAVRVRSQTEFLPKPVRVIFGAVVRPRTDAQLGTPGKEATGEAASGTQTVSALSDEETIFTSAYQRVGRGLAREFPLAGVPRQLATRVERPDLVELVALDGSSNATLLKEEALSLAKSIFRRQDYVRTTTYVFAHVKTINPDGVVDSVEIRTRDKNGPCGFETVVTTGSSAFRNQGGTGTRQRRPSAERGQDDREGVRP
jgi:hypothetical protein